MISSWEIFLYVRIFVCRTTFVFVQVSQISFFVQVRIFEFQTHIQIRKCTGKKFRRSGLLQKFRTYVDVYTSGSVCIHQKKSYSTIFFSSTIVLLKHSSAIRWPILVPKMFYFSMVIMHPIVYFCTMATARERIYSF